MTDVPEQGMDSNSTYRTTNRMNFVSYKQLVEDCKHFANQLPQDIRCIIGVPRSGMLPATLIGLQLNVPVITPNDWIAGWDGSESQTRARRKGDRVIVMDDSISWGTRMEKVERALGSAENFTYAVMYARKEVCHKVDCYYRNVEAYRVFEWNVFHSGNLARSILDIDGVLCHNPDGLEKDDGTFIKHIDYAKPLFLPTVPCMALCTSRLEKYRQATERWLKGHGVEYGTLIMAPYKTAKERRAANDNGKRKAAAYQRMGRKPRLFIESCWTQALTISEITGRPVLCTDTMELL